MKMTMDRRKFLKVMGLSGAASMLPLPGLMRNANAWASSPPLKKFMQALPVLGTGMPVATPDKLTYPGVDYYQIAMGEYTQQLHPQLPKATKLWGYYDVTNPVQKHLGGAIAATRGTPVRIKFTNGLPAMHPLPVDSTLPGAETTQAQNRAAVHLHGGLVHWTSDGGPFHWFLPDGTGGPDYDGFDYWYPNEQSARLMWYHDHAVGITRLNAYAGLATAYLVRDAAGGPEDTMIKRGMIPHPAREIPLVFQDKIFKTEFDQWGQPGDLWYPSLYDTNRWPWGGPGPKGIPPNISCVPEFSGDTMLVNGICYPFLGVVPRKYRFRILNACNTRFLRLQLVYASGTTFPADTEPSNPLSLGPKFLVIGTEGGFLGGNLGAAPSGVLTQILTLAPAERADVIIDFAGVPAGSKLLLYNDAPSPFPGGDPRNDYHPLNLLTPQSTAGFGPNTRTVMQIRVNAGAGDPVQPAVKLPLMDPPALYNWSTRALEPGVTVAATRDLTLNEDFDDYGRLIQTMGTNVRLYPNTYGRLYLDPPTEIIQRGTVEIWRIFNLTADTHPWHFHLVNVQIISRQRFDVAAYINSGTVTFTGTAQLPLPVERGWKETVQMHPGDCTTVIMKFDLPVTADPSRPTQPFSSRFVPLGINGFEYVQHCHILEHEEHDMMRPLVIT